MPGIFGAATGPPPVAMRMYFARIFWPVDSEISFGPARDARAWMSVTPELASVC